MNKALKKFDSFLIEAASANERREDEVTMGEMLEDLKRKGKVVPRTTLERRLRDEVDAGRMEVRQATIGGRIQKLYRIK
jgi:hypothetical protein